MKKLSLLALVAILLIIAFSTPLDAEEKLRVAVMDLANKTEISIDEALSLSKQIRMVASATLPKGKFLIMTKDNIKSLLPPKKSLAQCTTAKCVIELGRMISADYIITGSIIHFAGQMRIDFGAHHSLSADSLGGRTADAGNLKGLEAQLKAKSTEVMGLIMTHAGVTPPARSGGGAVFVSPTQPSSTGGAAEVRALAPTEQPPATASGLAGLYITSKPKGADVYLGQTKAGTTSPAFQKISLQPGMNVRVTLKMDLYHDVSFDVVLKSGVMKFEGVELKQAYGALKIESEPSGAQVFVGGVNVGTTPYSNLKQPSGDFQIRVEKKMYTPQQPQIITIQDGQATEKYFNLKADFGTLIIESKPTGAKVRIGGKEVGKTPYKDPYQASGDYLVDVELDWYIPVTDQTISIRGGKTTKKKFTLSQDFGTLDVKSNPNGAQVTLEGKKLGTTPGFWRVSPVSNGKVEVNLAKHRGKSFEITIDRDQTVKITVEQATLTAKVGSLQIYADPPEPGVKVFVDGKDVGTAPATVSDLIEGQHEVKVESTNKAGTATINISEGQTAIASVTLENRFGLLPGNELWVDQSTGLAWQVAPTGGEMNWAAAKSHCASLNLGGSSDWRLPTITELRSLIRGCSATQKGGACGVTDSCLSYESCRTSFCEGCSVKGGPDSGGAYWPPELSGEVPAYWSSSAVADRDGSAWCVDFYSGHVYDYYVPSGSSVRCVP